MLGTCALTAGSHCKNHDKTPCHHCNDDAGMKNGIEMLGASTTLL